MTPPRFFLVGEDDVGELNLDDEDGDRSFNFRMVIQVGSDPTMQPVPTLNAYLRLSSATTKFAW